MSSSLLMPALSPTMEHGRLVRWLVAPGAAVRAGQVVAEVETDKATLEIEADIAGTIAELLVAAGADKVRVGTPIARLLPAGTQSTAMPSLAPPSSPQPAPFPVTTASGLGGPISVAGDASPSPPLPRNAAWQPLATGNPVDRPRSGSDAVRHAISDAMREDDGIIVLVESSTKDPVAALLMRELAGKPGPARLIESPGASPAELVAMAIGAAASGLRPIVGLCSPADAVAALAPLIEAAGLAARAGGRIGSPLVVRGPAGAPAGQAGPMLAQWLAAVPGLAVLAPASAAEQGRMMTAALACPGPVLILESDGPEALDAGSAPAPEIGRARIVRPGRQATVVAYADGLTVALTAARSLAEEAIDVEVVDLRSLRPLDRETVRASVRHTHRIVIVDAAWPVCSIGAEIAADVAATCFDDLDAPPLRVAAADAPVPFATPLALMARPTAADVVKAVKAVCYAS
jgi:pyruvate dehydrogenase E1 component beta subunit